VGLTVVVLAAGWFAFGDEGDQTPTAEAAAEGGPVVLIPPEEAQPEPMPTRAPEPAPRLSSEAAPRDTAEQDVGESRLEELRERATALVEAGRQADARDLLRSALGSVGPREAGRIALQLARLEPDGHERRRLLSLAVSRHSLLGPEYEQVGGMLRDLNRSPAATLYGLVPTERYTVKPNDSLWRLCNQTFPEAFGVTSEVGLIQLVNGLGSATLQVGQDLLVPTDPLRIEIDRQEHGLVVCLGDVVLLAYRVGLGRENRTPQGEFVIRVKQEKPTWYRNGRAIPFGDPENVLGTRWMGFENHPGAMGYGIHGTDRPDSIGGDESMGCVRMRNEEVEELFELVPRGTVVSIP
jgi:lipoprotein-anchoring transpeptidase ErfK/SrfK